MGEVITIGLDIAKSVFQVHGVATTVNALRRLQVICDGCPIEGAMLFKPKSASFG
jgi:hypothetical protein